jgi:hypothetical protein
MALREMRAAPLAGGGYVRYESRFPLIEAALAIRCRAASLATAEKIVEDARQNLLNNDSYISGDLYHSLEVVEMDRVEDYAVASDVYYAPYVEFGTARSDAKPYMVPAVEANRGTFINEQTKAVAEAAAI